MDFDVDLDTKGVMIYIIGKGLKIYFQLYEELNERFCRNKVTTPKIKLITQNYHLKKFLKAIFSCHKKNLLLM